MRPYIPPSLATDKSVIILVSRWRNLLEQHAECRKRVNWNTKHARSIEKERRARRWVVESTLNDVEHAILKLCAEATQHHELYTPPEIKGGDPLTPQSFSLWDNLHREYYRNKRIPGPQHTQRNALVRKRTRKRHIIVRDIQALTWRWCSAVFKTVFPTQPLPPKRKTDYRVLRPKRLNAAHNQLAL